MPNPDTNTLERKILEVAELKTLDGDIAPNGGIAGYASTYANLDRVGDIVMPGAYDSTLGPFLKDGFLAESHDWDEPIGYILSARSDEKGLWFEAAFHNTERAQKVRRIVNERLAAGKSVSLSIGYRAKEYSYDDEGNRLLHAVTLYEVSVVTVPANPDALVVSGKAAVGDRHDAEVMDRYLTLVADLAGVAA